MAQTTANPGGTYGLGSGQRRAVAAVLAMAAAVGLVALLIAGPDTTPVANEGVAAVSTVAEFPQVDDFVSRRYLSSPAPADDSWKDDHITRRYLPGN